MKFGTAMEELTTLTLSEEGEDEADADDFACVIVIEIGDQEITLNLDSIEGEDNVVQFRAKLTQASADPNATA